MFQWDYARLKHGVQLAASAHKIFSTEELARLTELQGQFSGHPECVELEIDEQRLSFARWLADTGRISEEIDGT